MHLLITHVYISSTSIRIISKAPAEHHTDKDLFIEPASICYVYSIGLYIFIGVRGNLLPQSQLQFKRNED